jgi:formyl-CoA transferase
MLLGDFGADVTKIESPPAGEGGRRWGSSRYGAGDQFSSLFLAFNRNKASLMLDLK